MTGLDKQKFDGALKDVAEDGVSELVNNLNPLKDIMESESADGDFQGREILVDAHIGRNASPMFTREGGASPVGRNQVHAQHRIDQRKMMSAVQLTWEVMHDSTKREGSFVNARKDEFTRLIDDMARRQEFAMCNDGRGVFALLQGDPGTSSTTIELDSPGGIAGSDFGNRYIEKGMYLGAVNPSTGALRAGIIEVLDVNEDGTDITSDAATNSAWADNDYVVQVANSSVTSILDTSYEAAWWGITALFDDGTYRPNYYGLDRNTIPALKSYVVGSTGALSIDLLQRVSDVLAQKLGGKIDLILCHHSIRRLYLQLLDQDRRYNGASLMKPDGGTAAIKQGDVTVGEVPIRVIPDFPLAMMLLLDTTGVGLKQYVSEKGKWVDEDGNILMRTGSGNSFTDTFEARYRMRKQYFAAQPGKAARLDTITGQTLVVVRRP